MLFCDVRLSAEQGLRELDALLLAGQGSEEGSEETSGWFFHLRIFPEHENLSLQRTGPDDGVTGTHSQVDSQGNGPPSHHLLAEVFMPWEYYFGMKVFLQL